LETFGLQQAYASLLTEILTATRTPDIAYISAPVVKWAREREGLTEEELATHLKNVKPSNIGACERGESLPTFSQAEKLSEKLRVPFVVLFMEEPPEISLPIPDLRTLSNVRQKPSLEFFDVVCDALLRQRWYREFQEQREADKLPSSEVFALVRKSVPSRKTWLTGLVLTRNSGTNAPRGKVFLSRSSDLAS
jgi:transcriptional regulator with XRE-family HTH domain